MLHALPRVLANPQKRQNPLFNLSQLPARARDVFPTNVTPSPSPLAYKIAQNGMTCLSPENEESFVISPPPEKERRKKREKGPQERRRRPSFCGNASSFEQLRGAVWWHGTSFFPRWKKGIEYLSTSVEEGRKEKPRGREGGSNLMRHSSDRASDRFFFVLDLGESETPSPETVTG